MSEYVVRISQEAQDHLDHNALWWAENYDVEQANQWALEFRDEIMDLRFLPASRPLAIENDQVPFEVRNFHFRGYRALFTIIEDVVLVLAVKRDQQMPLALNEIKYP